MHSPLLVSVLDTMAPLTENVSAVREDPDAGIENMSVLPSVIGTR